MMEFLLIFHTLVMSGFIDINSGFIFASIYSVAIAHIALPLQAIHVCICTNEHTRTYILFFKFSGLLLLPFRNFTGILGSTEHALRTVVVDTTPRKIRSLPLKAWRDSFFRRPLAHLLVFIESHDNGNINSTHICTTEGQKSETVAGCMEKLRVIHFQYSKLLSSVTLGFSCCTGVYTSHLPVSSAARMFYFRQPHQALLFSKSPWLESLYFNHAFSSPNIS